jgi:hypothetical protein
VVLFGLSAKTPGSRPRKAAISQHWFCLSSPDDSTDLRIRRDGFLGGDSTWQKLNLDTRTYVPVTRDGRHILAFWLFADLVVGGVAP